jgi:hypothetical protein
MLLRALNGRQVAFLEIAGWHDRRKEIRLKIK